MLKSTTIRCAALAAALTLSCGTTAAGEPERPMGWTDGAETMRVTVEDGQIDTISGIVYHQVKSLRAARQLRMTLMIPRTKEKKPAVVYFPGGLHVGRPRKVHRNALCARPSGLCRGGGRIPHGSEPLPGAPRRRQGRSALSSRPRRRARDRSRTHRPFATSRG